MTKETTRIEAWYGEGECVPAGPYHRGGHTSISLAGFTATPVPVSTQLALMLDPLHNTHT